MSRMVQCAMLGIEAEGLDRAPFPGEKGQRIFDNISKQAWKKWMGHQTMLINEHRLSVIDPKAREYLEQQMLKFLFEGGADKVEGYTPPPS